MIKNYFTIALRNLLKQRFYAILNILGLSIGIASCLLILLYVADELSYDRFHTKADRIYRVGLNGKIAGQDMHVAVTCPPLAEATVSEFPEVEMATRLSALENEVVRYEDVVYAENEVFFADSNFFSMFDYRLLEGDPKTALKEPNTLVMTESTARKYFGQENPLGKMLTVGDDNVTYTVSGVVEDLPENAHFHFDILYAMAALDISKQDIWLSNSFYTYLMLGEKANASTLESKLTFLVEKYVGPQIQQYMGISPNEFEQQGGKYGYFLQPLTNIHLHSNLKGEMEPNGNITYVYVLLAIAVFIIFVACINFMNLTTARSANRAQEIGVRKSLGSLRRDLIMQFLIESTLMSMLSFLVAIALTSIFIVPFNALSGKSIDLDTIQLSWLVTGAVILMILVGLIAGSYPAFYLSSFRPVEVLKGKIRGGTKSSIIRNILVVFQFAISVVLIVCTVLVYQQLEHISSKNLGFDKENILVVSNGSGLEDKVQIFRQNVTNETQVVNASVSTAIMPYIENTTVFRPEGSDEDHILTIYAVDYEHLPTLKMSLKEGRNFSPDFSTDTAALVLNEAAVRELGFDHPIGQKLTYFDSDGSSTLQVIGVVKDFNYQSLRNDVLPIAMTLSRRGEYVAIRIRPGQVKRSVDIIQSKWEGQFPNEPFEYSFLDQDFDALFRAEQRLGKISIVFTTLAMFIACLGLLGLVAYITEQRTKEIGIRKVMGASTISIVGLFSKDLMILVFIAISIAIPISYWTMNSWLDNFAYRINISAETFVIAGLVVMVVAWLAVIVPLFKAAKSDPAHSLRSE